MLRRTGVLLALACLSGVVLHAQSAVPATPSADTKIPYGARVFITPGGGFENFLAAALIEEKVPVVVVTDKTKADFEITVASDAGDTGGFFTPGRDAAVATKVTNLKTSVVVFARSDTKNPHRDMSRLASEAATRLKKYILEGKN